MKKIATTTLLSAALSLTLPAGSVQAANFLVGEHSPLSGKMARVGTGAHRGIVAGLHAMNEKYKGTHTFELKTIDDESSPAKAVSAVEKLASEGVLAFTGGYGSNIIGPASEAAHKANLPYITFGAVADELSQRGHQGFFRINNSEGYGKAVIGLVREMDIQKVTILFSNKEATSNMAHYVEDALKQAGIKVITHEYDTHTKDFKSLVNKVKFRDKPKAILMVGYEAEYVGVLRAAKVLKPDVKAMIGLWGLATGKMADEFPDLMENVYGTAMLPFPASFDSPLAQDFYTAYKANFEDEPSYLEQFGYVQTRLLLEAIVKAHDQGDLTTEGISRELRKTDELTVTGRVRFNENGDNPEFAQRIGQHQQGKIPLVWPPQDATGAKVFPGTPW